MPEQPVFDVPLQVGPFLKVGGRCLVGFLDPAADFLMVGTDAVDAEHLSPSGRYGRHRGRPG
ncbi:hypothetical protein OHA72_50380 [Dactylosporangium sp. NBC_01737]|uniref:hypothetical protein n=1 Tax=Dactylosporangium sp. NBC_01737 TaxID=2975959 RepID=UPI002E13AF87|nr:hypothetical protein OHA72_50380 [Dactylosporangium sp. NBC_01737]